jgi:hypothetical protein
MIMSVAFTRSSIEDGARGPSSPSGRYAKPAFPIPTSSIDLRHMTRGISTVYILENTFPRLVTQTKATLKMAQKLLSTVLTRKLGIKHPIVQVSQVRIGSVALGNCQTAMTLLKIRTRAGALLACSSEACKLTTKRCI